MLPKFVVSRVSRTTVLLVAAILTTAVVFHDALQELVHRWTQQDEYSHSFLIPFVAVWLLWLRRDALRTNTGCPTWLGPALVLSALAIHVIGELGAIFILSQIGLWIALVGIVLAIGGYTLLRAAFVPIAFLLFAIPLPYFVDSILTLRLQLVSSELGAFFIRMFGIPVYLDGNIIDLGDYKLQVAEACSGLRYLYPLLSLSFLAAYLFQAPRWQRVLIFLSGIPIAIGMNGLRIGLVGVMVDRFGSRMADGALHMFEGWVIFVACTAVLAAEIFLMAAISGRAFTEAFYVPSGARAFAVPQSHPASMRPLMACLVLLCAGGLAVSSLSGRSEAVPERTRFVEFPTRIDQWQGHTSLLDPDSERVLGLSDYILSDYIRPDGEMVNLYVAYYASQRDGESPHSPIVCIPGGGWTITKIEQIDYGGIGQRQPINRVVIQKGDLKQLVYYWFDERGRPIASEWWAKIYLLTDAVLRNRTDGALIRLTTQVLPSETDADADRRLQSFMQEAVPTLSQFLPPAATQQTRSSADPLQGGQS
jgi:exosortase D (VPLPA-CTERM-specific)